METFFEFVFLVDRVKILYTKFPETATNWMNLLKDNCINFSGHNTQEAQNKVFTDMNFDLAYRSEKETNLIAILEQDTSPDLAWPKYSVLICRINFEYNPKNKDQVINKIFKIDEYTNNHLYHKFFSVPTTTYPKGQEVFPVFTNAYFSSNTNKVMVLGMSYYNKETESQPSLATMVEARVISKNKGQETQYECVKTSMTQKFIQMWLEKRNKYLPSEGLSLAKSRLLSSS